MDIFEQYRKNLPKEFIWDIQSYMIKENLKEKWYYKIQN